MFEEFQSNQEHIVLAHLGVDPKSGMPWVKLQTTGEEEPFLVMTNRLEDIKVKSRVLLYQIPFVSRENCSKGIMLMAFPIPATPSPKIE